MFWLYDDLSRFIGQMYYLYKKIKLLFTYFADVIVEGDTAPSDTYLQTWTIL